MPQVWAHAVLSWSQVAPVSTGTGAARVVVVPSPTSPKLLWPQQNACPATSRAHECQPPVVTDSQSLAVPTRSPAIETSSLPHYELTRRFYLKHGYEQAAVLRDFYSDGDDMVI